MDDDLLDEEKSLDEDPDSPDDDLAGAGLDDDLGDDDKPTADEDEEEDEAGAWGSD